MKVNFKRLNDLAKMPYRGSNSAAGYDMYAATSYNITIEPHNTIFVGTGIAMEIPEGYFGAVYARSGLACKRNLRPENCVGIIDSDYRGEIVVALHNDSELNQTIEAGERIAQLIIQPYLEIEFDEVNELDDTERGEGGFGHSGRK